MRRRERFSQKKKTIFPHCFDELLRMQTSTIGLQFAEHVSEESRFGIESKHVAREPVDNK